MGRIAVTKQVRAPRERVFATVAQLENFRKAIPEIVGVEFVGDTRKGVGARFRETRLMGKRERDMEAVRAHCERPG